jgi:nucleoside-diphosphate-sugar epimerase
VQDAPNPADDYAKSNGKQNRLCWILKEVQGWKVVIIQPHSVYGPGVKGDSKLIQLMDMEFRFLLAKSKTEEV